MQQLANIKIYIINRSLHTNKQNTNKLAVTNN